MARIYLGNVKGPQGATGATGATGPQGEAATIEVGSVSTTAYGNAAQVTGNTKVIVINKSIINNNVYGGGNAATVTGNTDVQIGE